MSFSLVYNEVFIKITKVSQSKNVEILVLSYKQTIYKIAPLALSSRDLDNSCCNKFEEEEVKWNLLEIKERKKGNMELVTF